MSKISILGSGGFGISIAIMCERMGHDVTVWSAFKDEIEAIKRDGEHKKLLPNIKVPTSIKLVTDINEISGCDLAIFGIPTAFLREVANKAKPFIGANTVIVNTGKGLEDVTHKGMYEVLEDIYPNNKIAVLTGPSHAEEVAVGFPTTIVAASKKIDVANYVQDQLANETLRIYVNEDVIGCELGGALKNIIALCAGICDGMKYGDNTKAALMTRGMSEITRLGVKLGAKPQTFSGLTGVGDLIVTCTSMHSRNRRAGILIGQGTSPEEAVKTIGTVEGYFCTKVAWELSHKYNVAMPIVEELYQVLYCGKDVKEGLKSLMSRPKKHEMELNW